MRKSETSPNRLLLLEKMQAIYFGQIKELHVRNGEPVFTPSPQMIRKIKFGGKNSQQNLPPDFELKAKLLGMFDCFKELNNGVILNLEIKYGLPFDMDLKEEAML